MNKPRYTSHRGNCRLGRRVVTNNPKVKPAKKSKSSFRTLVTHPLFIGCFSVALGIIVTLVLQRIERRLIRPEMNVILGQHTLNPADVAADKSTFVALGTDNLIDEAGFESFLNVKVSNTGRGNARDVMLILTTFDSDTLFLSNKKFYSKYSEYSLYDDVARTPQILYNKSYIQPSFFLSVRFPFTLRVADSPAQLARLLGSDLQQDPRSISLRPDAIPAYTSADNREFIYSSHYVDLILGSSTFKSQEYLINLNFVLCDDVHDMIDRYVGSPLFENREMHSAYLFAYPEPINNRYFSEEGPSSYFRRVEFSENSAIVYVGSQIEQVRYYDANRNLSSVEIDENY